MPIYPVGEAPEGVLTTSFKERGLIGRGPVKIEDSGIFAYSLQMVSTSVLFIISYIHMFFQSNVDGKATVIMKDFNRIVHLVTVFPVVSPLLYIKGQFSNADKEVIRGMGFTDAPDNHNGSFIGRPNISDVQKLTRDLGVEEDGRVTVDNVNVAGFVAFRLAWQCIGIFMRTVGHRATGDMPGWKFVDESEDYQTMAEHTSGLGWDSETRDVVFREMEDGGDMGTSELSISNNFKLVVEPVKQTGLVEGRYWVDLTYEPFTMGFLFPYFAELLVPSMDFIGTVIFRYFSKCFANTPEDTARLMPLYRTGFRSLYRTPQGRELQHVLFGIQMAIETGGRIRIIVDNGVYRGFLMLGKDIRILDHKVLKSPLSKEQLKKEMSSLNVHRSTIDDIIKYLMTVGTLEEGFTIDAERMYRSARYLNSEIVKAMARAEDRDSVKTMLSSSVEKLQYGQVFWELTTANIIKAIQAMITGRIDMEEPLYLGGNIWCTDNKLLLALGAFGKSAPTIIAGQETFNISRSKVGDQNLVIGENRLRKLQYIPIYVKSVEQACTEWNMVRTKHYLKMYSPKKGNRGFTDRTKATTIVAGNEFDDFYEKVREFSWSFEEMRTGFTGTKKRLDGPDSAEGSGGKRSKGNRPVASDFYA